VTPAPACAAEDIGQLAWQVARSELLGLAALALLAPLFWFPWRWPCLTLAALAVIPVCWAAAWRSRGHFVSRGGLEAKLVFVLLATCVATIPIVDWQLGLPKVLGMALGIAMVTAVSNAISSHRGLGWALLALAGVALVLAALGAVSAQWVTGKIVVLDWLASRLPALARRLSPAGNQGGINPNELAGALVLVFPVLLVQVCALAEERGWRPWHWPRRSAVRCAALLFVSSIVFGMMALTQSRSGLIGIAAECTMLGGALAIKSVASHRLPLAVRAAVLPIYAGIVSIGSWFAWRTVERWSRSTGSADALSTFEARRELWIRGWYMVQDFAYTGIGLGQFNPILHRMYPPFLLPPDQFVPHAHNVYLEYALELGVPGAVAFAFLVLAFFRQCWRAVRSTDPLLRWTGLGLVLGMIGFMVYGLTDAIAPGARGGLVMWIVLGLGTASGNLAGITRAGEAPDNGGSP